MSTPTPDNVSARSFTYKYYRAFIETAISGGYRFIGFPEFVDNGQNVPAVCVLRHDCDNDIPSTLPIAEIEKSYGVRSTYFVMLRSAMYNMLSLPNLRIVDRLLSLDHSIGLHFDEYLVRDLSIAQVADEVERECEQLEREIGVPVQTVSFHQPGQRVLDNLLKIRRINTYDRKQLAGLEYFSDSWGRLRTDLIDLVRSGKPERLQVLLHTEWWGTDAFDRGDRWRDMFLRNFEQMRGELIAREPAYAERHRIEIVSDPSASSSEREVDR